MIGHKSIGLFGGPGQVPLSLKSSTHFVSLAGLFCLAGCVQVPGIPQPHRPQLQSWMGSLPVIDGVLYDIEQSVVTGNSITLHLQKDEGETKWKDHYSKLNSLLHKQKNSKTATASKASGIFLVFF